MGILKDLPELIKANVITPETADKIRDYYHGKSGSSSNRLLMVFGVLGALLVGLGIVLIIAHNWDELPRVIKTGFAFFPLLVGQVLCGYVLIKKTDQAVWRESTTTFLFFSVAASLALISQIYNIPGNLTGFLLTWALLCLPLIYVMQSSVASLLYIVIITYYACETSYWSYPTETAYWYWPLLIAALPYYYQLYRKKSESNFTVFHHWFIPLSVIIVLGTVSGSTGELMFVAYFSLFGLLYLIGNSELLSRQKLSRNGYKILGSLGTIILLLILSFDWFWEDLSNIDLPFNELMRSPEFFAAALLSILAGGLFIFQQKGKSIGEIQPLAPMFLLFIITFIIGLYSMAAVMLINIFILATSILTIRSGAQKNHLGLLNYGLLIITALVACRFFDTNLSFVIRGLLFVLVGAGFFAANYWMIKKGKNYE